MKTRFFFLSLQMHRICAYAQSLQAGTVATGWMIEGNVEQQKDCRV